MPKPTRTFSADVGQKSTGAAGPDQIEHDLDNLFAMFDPAATLKDGSVGGIGGENMKAGSLTDAALADVTIDQEQLPVDTGKAGRLLSGIANALRSIKGTLDWKSLAATSLQYLLDNKADKGHSHGNPQDGHTHDAFIALDIFGVSRQIITNMAVTRDINKRIVRMDYTTSEDSGSVVFHRDALGRQDCARLFNSLDTQIQIELIRGGDGRVSNIYRSGFNTYLQSGLAWPIE